MTTSIESIVQHIYDAFNKRDIDTALHLLAPDVHWPNGWEGGYVHGREEVKDYWTRQWKEIDPSVHPLSIMQGSDGRIRVTVKQIIKDRQGKLLFEGQVAHVYTIEHDLIQHMEIEK